MPKISKRIVDATAPIPTARRYVWDSALAGFGLVVQPSGHKSFVYQFRNAAGQSRRIRLGTFGSITAEEARRLALDMAERVRRGHDPSREKQERQNAPTVGGLLDAYLQSAQFQSKAISTQAIDRGRIERHLLPTVGRRHVEDITPDDVQRALAAIRDGKTAVNVKTGKRGRARVTGGAGTARMAIELLRAVFGWAISERRAKSNPCDGIKTGASGTRSTIVNGTDDYERLFRALEQMEAEGRIRSAVADAVRIIALTGARRGEVAGLKWSHVDLRKNEIVLPPAAHKTGKRTQKPRIISLPSAAAAIVARQPAGGGPDDYVFAPAQGNGPISLSKPWRAIRQRADLPAGIGLHGLRHSLASHMAMGGAEAASIMVQMGHRQLSTAQRYVHFVQSARLTIAEQAAAPVLAGMAAAAGSASAEVVSLSPRRGK